jgi:hypothetical protein
VVDRHLGRHACEPRATAPPAGGQGQEFPTRRRLSPLPPHWVAEMDPARLHAAQSRIRECIDRGLPPSPADLQICLAAQDAPTLDTLLMAAMVRNGQLEAEMAVLRRELEALRAAKKVGRREQT